MQKHSAKKVSERDTSKARKSNIGTNRKQHESAEVEKGDSGIGLPGFHLLGKHLKSKSMLEIEHAMGITLKDRTMSTLKVDYTMMLQTEAMRLNVIEDLYAIVKAQPAYQNLKEPVWTEHTQSIEVISWLCKKLSPLAKGKYWFIDKRLIDGKQKHVFVVIDFFHSQKVDFASFPLPVEFLPYLATKDSALHDIIVDTIALAVKEGHVTLWDEYEYTVRALDMCWSEQLSESDKDSLYVYTNGEAAKYAKLIRQRAKKATYSSLRKLILAYIPNSECKRMTINWVTQMCNLSDHRERIQQYDWYPHYSGTKNPYTASKKYSIHWSIHKTDIINKTVEKLWDKEATQYGQFLPAVVTVTAPGEVYVESVKTNYPEHLHDAMKWGWSVILRRFQSYYFRNSMSQNYSLSLQLLNKEKYATKSSK